MKTNDRYERLYEHFLNEDMSDESPEINNADDSVDQTERDIQEKLFMIEQKHLIVPQAKQKNRAMPPLPNGSQGHYRKLSFASQHLDDGLNSSRDQQPTSDRESFDQPLESGRNTNYQTRPVIKNSDKRRG